MPTTRRLPLKMRARHRSLARPPSRTACASLCESYRHTYRVQVSSIQTVVPETSTPSRRPSATSPPLHPSSAQASPKPHLEKKPSAIGKLFHHKGATPTGSANASTTSLAARGPPPAKSTGARSPNMHSGDESDGHSESSVTSAGGALRALGRRMSSNKPAAPSPQPDEGRIPERRPSAKKTTSHDVPDPTGKLERKQSTKDKGEGHMTLKEYVAAHSGGLMSRKPSNTRCAGRRSYIQ